MKKTRKGSPRGNPRESLQETHRILLLFHLLILALFLVLCLFPTLFLLLTLFRTLILSLFQVSTPIGRNPWWVAKLDLESN